MDGALGTGLRCAGPLAERAGRRGAFLLMHLCAAAIVPITGYLPHTYWQMLLVLPAFGFFTGGIHAGYAIYFPELFPNHLRATGAGFCYNIGRIAAAVGTIFAAQITQGGNYRVTLLYDGFLFIPAMIFTLFLPVPPDEN